MPLLYFAAVRSQRGTGQLIRLLGERNDAFEACRLALEDGASFRIFEDPAPLPAHHYARIYARRERLTRNAGRPTLGFREAADRLGESGDQPLRLGQVTVISPPYHFQLFLTADISAVVACLGVDQQHQAGRRQRDPV
ncbi:hypothetical protein [Catellatospora sichuanensis]|uniref:hypothetical protein n=1 Tax=Catellatospora sichuanensis TaxID=1969805 RepID=UPI001184408A|nr:hypothetical protein [Catellatospora sichuanensis]